MGTVSLETMETWDDDSWRTALASNDHEAPSSPHSGVAGIETDGVSTIFAPMPPVPWLVHGLRLAPGRPTMIAGYSYSGKTLVAQSIALAIASGRLVWGIYSVPKGPALCLDFELGPRLIRSRFQRLARGMGVDPRELDEGQLRCAHFPPFKLDDPQIVERLTRACDGVAICIIDSFTASTSCDENSTAAGGPGYRLAEVSAATGCTFLLIHHARKPSKDAAGGATMAVRGSSAIFGSMGSVFVMGGPKGEPVRVSHEKEENGGQTLPDFGLAFDDVEIGGVPMAGLRVRHLDPEQMEEPKSNRKALDRCAAAVLALLAKGPFPGSVTTMRDILAVSKNNLSSAIAELLQSGKIVRSGTEKAPVWSLP